MARFIGLWQALQVLRQLQGEECWDEDPQEERYREERQGFQRAYCRELTVYVGFQAERVERRIDREKS